MFKMPYIKSKHYCDIPFSFEANLGDFYIYHPVRDLVQMSIQNTDKTIRCRSVGLLQSVYGKFILKDIDFPIQDDNGIRVSMAYIKIVPSLVVPQAVQLFGFLQWKEQPVIFVKLLQVLNIDTAIKIKDSMHRITRLHLARGMQENYEEPNEGDTT